MIANRISTHIKERICLTGLVVIAASILVWVLLLRRGSDMAVAPSARRDASWLPALPPRGGPGHNSTFGDYTAVDQNGTLAGSSKAAPPVQGLGDEKSSKELGVTVLKMRELANENYKKCQTASFDWLREHPEDWGTNNLWFLMGPFHSCPLHRRIGEVVDGGKWICDLPLAFEPPSFIQAGVLQRPCHVYSLGSGGLMSFEKQIVELYPHCSVHTFDHTVDELVANQTNALPGVTFHAKGITNSGNLAASGPQFTTINASMTELDIPWLDVLKMDIEGGEWGVLLELLESDMQLPFTQILVEIHTIFGVPPGVAVHDLLRRFFTGMHSAGYRIFAFEPNFHAVSPPSSCFELAFIKVDDHGTPIRPYVT